MASNANRNAMDYTIEEKTLTANDKLQIHIATRREVFFGEIEEGIRIVFEPNCIATMRLFVASHSCTFRRFDKAFCWYLHP